MNKRQWRSKIAEDPELRELWSHLEDGSGPVLATYKANTWLVWGTVGAFVALAAWHLVDAIVPWLLMLGGLSGTMLFAYKAFKAYRLR